MSDFLAAAERAVVGAMLKSPRAIDEVATVVTADDFTDPDLAAIFRAATSVRAEAPGASIDWLQVSYRAETSRDVSPFDLQQLVNDVPTVANVSFYARQVADAGQIRRYREAATSILATVESGADAGTVAQRAQNALHGAVSRTATGGMDAVDYAALMAVQDAVDEYDWVVPDYLERGDRLVLTGHEGLGKSMLLRQIAVMTAGGLNFVTGKSIPSKRVLVVDVENPERMWRRTTRRMHDNVLSRGHDFGDRLHVACHGRIDLNRPDDLASLYRLVDMHAPDLMVIGPLYKLTPKGINSDDDAAPIITALDGIRDRGITLCLETHMGHSTAGPGGPRNVRPRGSAALLGWPEFGYGIAPATSAASEGQDIPGLVDFIPWRGQRDKRAWPDQWHHGSTWPWEQW